MTLARTLLVATLLASPALAGCFGATSSGLALAPFTPLVRAEPGRATEIAVLVNNTGPFRQDLALAVEGLPSGWTFTAWPNGSLVVDGHARAVAIYSIAPADGAKHGPQGLRLRAGGGAADVVVDVRDLGAETARAGVGVTVRTVGFFPNGSVFYTNMKEVRDDARIPWVMLSADAKDDAGMQPLAVFVGGERGKAPPEPYNRTGYHPVIAGFDARLREGNGGMRAGETLAVRIPKEHAYTLPGNEKHPLYGFDLDFVIEVATVDILPPDRSGVCVPGTETCLPPP